MQQWCCAQLRRWWKSMKSYGDEHWTPAASLLFISSMRWFVVESSHRRFVVENSETALVETIYLLWRVRMLVQITAPFKSYMVGSNELLKPCNWPQQHEQQQSINQSINRSIDHNRQQTTTTTTTTINQSINRVVVRKMRPLLIECHIQGEVVLNSDS
jgi:hypothetical protein